MKVPMPYQMTEFDCGPTAIINAVQYLYDINEIPPDFPKRIWSSTLDGYNGNGIAYRTGTTDSAIRFLGDWFNQYGRMTDYPIKTKYIHGEQVTLKEDSEIIKALKKGDSVVIRCIFDVGHYITLTGIDGDCIQAFDPYWMDKELKVSGLTYVHDHPKEYNRLISRKRMDSEDGDFYSLDTPDKRHALIFCKCGEGRTFKAFE